MKLRLSPHTESRLQELSVKTGRAPDDLVEDAMAGYLRELTDARELLDSRYDELKSGGVQPLDGDEALSRLRQKSKGDSRRAR